MSTDAIKSSKSVFPQKTLKTYPLFSENSLKKQIILKKCMKNHQKFSVV